MINPSTPFFTPGSELADLEDHIRRLQSSAHAPPVDRAEHILVNIQRTMLRKHEAELQIRIAARTGYHDHQQVWQGKIDTIDQQIAELTIALRGRVNRAADGHGGGDVHVRRARFGCSL